MNGNYRNSYRGGSNDSFSREQFNYNYQIPHDRGFHYAGDIYLPYQTPAHYYDMRHSTHQMPAHYPGMWHPTHQIPAHYPDMRPLPHHRPHLPKQKPKHYDDKRPLSQQTLKDFADKKISPHKKPEDFVDKKCLPQQMPEHYADKRDLPQQNLEHHVIQNCALKTNDQPKSISMDLHIPAGSNISALTKDTCSSSDAIAIAPPQGPTTSQINSQTKVKEGKEHHEVQNGGVKDCAAKKCLPRQMPKPTIPSDKKCLPPQMPKPTIPSDKKCLPTQLPKPTIPSDKKFLQCEICHCRISPNHIEQHNNGRRHQSHLKSMEHNTSKGEVSGHIQNSQMNPVVQPKEVPKSMKDGRPVENMSQFRFKEVPAEGCKKLGDHTVAKDQMPKPTIPSDKKGLLRCEVCHVMISPNYIEQHNNGKKHQRNAKSMERNTSKGEVSGHIQNSQMNPVVQPKEIPKSMKDGRPVENMSQFRCKEVPAEGCKKLGDHTVAKDQMPKPTIPSDKKCLPRKMPKPTIPSDKKCLPHQMPKSTIPSDKKCLPPQMPNPTIPSNRKFVPLCEICHVRVPYTNTELHNNGKKHRRNLKSKECKISKGEVSGHIQNSQMNPVVQPKKVSKSIKDGRPVEKGSQFRCKEVPAEGSKRKLGDQTVAEDHGFKVKKSKNEAPSFKNNKVPAEKRKVSDNTDAKDHGSKPEIGETSGAKFMKTNSGIRKPVKSSKSESPHVSASLSKESKGKEHHKFQNTVEKNDQPQSTPVELNASEGSNKTESMSCNFAAIAPPQVPVNCPVFTPSPAVESRLEPSIQTGSQIEVEQGKEHHDIQNRGVETNDQPQSITMELHATGASDINTLIKEDTGSDSGAIVIIPSQSPIASQVATPVAAVKSSFEPESQQVIQTEMSDDKVHDEIQNHTVDSNDQQQSISMELDDPSGCMTNTQTEVVNSDSAATGIIIEPLAYALPDAVGFEPLTEHGLHTEIEPQVSEAVVYYESNHPIEEPDIELPPSVPIEIDAASEVSTETKTADGSPQAEVEMGVLADELGVIQLPQVSVCLTCGDEGFEETLVYCNKCEDCALHRYCLDGPVIFTDEVIWFCENCKEEVIDTDNPYHDQVTSDSEKSEVCCSDGCVTEVDPQPIADPIWRGSLQVFHKSDDKITRLMAHLSTLACPKVLEETRHLPNVLYGNLLQRSAVWPASFKKFGTNNLSIGLYFFPQNESVERYYDLLVDEMISNDLAISARFEKSELLIFASTMLPSQYKRFQSKYYLWGIFKRKQAASTIKDS